MKKIKNKIVCVFLVLIFLSIIIVSLNIDNEVKKRSVIYNIDAVVSDNFLKGEMLVEYINNEDFTVDELCFSLYPNSFKNENNLQNLVVAEKFDKAYPKGFDSGYINVKSIFVNNEKIEYYYENDEQILVLKALEAEPGEEIKIKIVFEEKLPYSPMRFGYGENTYNFGNWYPILCPFVNGEPYKCIYNSNGDPFFSECADYNVTLTIPNEFRIATSGRILNKNVLDPINTKWIIRANNVRDFAFVLSSKYNLQSIKSGDTIVYSYYLGDDIFGDYSLEVAKDAVEIFNKIFGEYPYSTLSIAESDFYIGGMEYPNVVFINTELYNDAAKDALEEVIVHEIAHQWWYGVVGNNQIEEAWIDEGLTQYSVALYYEKKYGTERYKSYLNECELYCKVVFDVLKEKDIPFEKKIDRKTNEFEHWLLYDAITYDVSALMLDELRNKIGDNDLFNGLKYYYENNMYKVSSGEIFVNSMKKRTKKNIEEILKPWLSGKIYWG